MSKTQLSVDETKIPLNRVLGVGTAILLVAGNIIGTGVFKKIVPMAATGLNTSSVLAAWLVAGFITLLGAFSIAGLARLTTESGGLYEYLRLTFGKFISFISGWSGYVIVNSGSVAAIGFIFAQSVNSIVPLPDPLKSWENISIGHFIYPFASSGVKLLAIVTIAVLTWINYQGVKKGSALNNVVTILKVLGILVLIVLGIILTAPTQPIQQVIHTSPIAGGSAFFAAFFTAALSAFWAYDGFANVSYVTGEIKRPKRNVPIAIITGVCLVILLYVLVNYAYIKSVSLSQLASLGENKIAASVVAGSLLGRPGTIFISLLIMLSSFGTLNVLIIFYARLYYRMAQKNMFFKSAAKVHPVHRTPYISLLYSMGWSLFMVITGTFDMLTDMSVFIAFIFYSLLAAGLIKMKRKKVIKEKIPGYPWAPIIFILFTLCLSVNTLLQQPVIFLIGTALVLTGIPFYFYFKKYHSGDEVNSEIPTED